MRFFHFSSDIRSVAFIVSAIAIYAVQWLGLVRHPVLFAAGLCFAFIACVINHNHQHHPTFVSYRLNCAFGVLISLAAGVPATAIIPMHNVNHHAHNNDADDFSRVSIVRCRWNLINLLLYPFVALAGYAPMKSRDLSSWRTSRPRLYRQLMLERSVIYPAFLVLLAVRPLEAMTYFALPYFFGQWAIIAINHVQHVGCNPGSEYDHSRNVVGRCLNWWTFNNGFHTAHHLKPNLHWSLLPEFHEEIRKQISPELERESVLWTLFELYVWPACIPELKRTNSRSDVPDHVNVDRRAAEENRPVPVESS